MEIEKTSSIEDVDNALLLEILVRGLSTYSHLTQCKVVSKRWLSMISSPIFLKQWKEDYKTLHANHKKPIPYTLITNVTFPNGILDHYIGFKIVSMEIEKTSSIEDVDDDLLLEILVQGLSTYSHLTQCKVVSKRWLSMICSPIFLKQWKENYKTLHGNCKRPLPYTLIANLRFSNGILDHYIINHTASKHPLVQSKRFDLGFLPFLGRRRGPRGRGARVRIAAICDDLLLCHSTLEEDISKSVYYVCNPLTRQWVALPPFLTFSSITKDIPIGLTCNGNSYRVVRIHDSGTATTFLAEIFSPETNKWDMTEVSHPYNKEFAFDWCWFPRQMCSWNGLLFLPTRLESYVDGIVGYNPWEPERCHTINMPEGEYVECVIFGACGGSLRLLLRCFCESREIHTGCFKIWQLENYEEGEWSLKKEITYEEFLIKDNDPLQDEMKDRWERPDLRGLALDPNDEDVAYFYHSPNTEGDDYCERILSCNLWTKKVKELDRFDQHHDLRNIFWFVIREWPTPVPPLPQIAHPTQ
ncbi:hypothetical protein Tsubulata_027849 [Turnera subulata]|uniref:F-box protein At3g26010-like beta-propeller domain-containing protein n=1 Tax=Turnera subulata TaxID=218843 RepID=A0A9Q0J0Z8_9ROSI|nr:hypothetical protein Tsubulata_027849 [Turnera subulata]